jgi:hypothetical protein
MKHHRKFGLIQSELPGSEPSTPLGNTFLPRCCDPLNRMAGPAMWLNRGALACDIKLISLMYSCLRRKPTSSEDHAL